MYSRSIINAKIEAAVQKGRPVPEYHSIAECKQAIDHLKYLYEYPDKGPPKQILQPTPDETAWIRNERFLCAVDFHYFSTHYCRIKSEEDMVVDFQPWNSQSIFFDIVAEMEALSIAIMLIILKARQLGISRAISLMILHRIVHSPHVNAVIASSTPDKTRRLGDMLDFTFDRLPTWMIPTITARREGELIEFGKVDTGIAFQHGAQMTGISRGTTPTVAHLSELAEFLDPASIVDSSLLRAMHDSEKTLLTLEGTAEGQHNWWHNKWVSSKVGWPEHRSRLRPMFLPWFVGNLYPKPVWLRARPVPDRYIPQPWVTDHANRAKDYVKSDPLLTKYLGSGWSMPVEQQWYYEVERGEAIRENRLNKFLQEMPASDDEAFQSTNISVFSTETITAHRDRTKSPLGVYGLLGPSDLVTDRLSPARSEIDFNQPPITIDYPFGNGTPIKFQLVPLRWHGFPTDSGLDKIYIWEKPEPGEVYGLGIDTADGIGKDRTCIEGLRKGNLWRPAAQILEFASDKLNALDVTPFAMALASYFSPPGPDPTETFRRQCRVAIECRGKGDQLQLQMRLNGWSNFHPWQRVDNKKLDPSQYNKIGIFTNEWYRASMMEYSIKMIRDMELDIRSPFFVSEMQALEGNMLRQSLKAAYGANDDRFMSLGFILISLYQWERNRPVSTNSNIQRPSETQIARYASWPTDPHSRTGIV